MNSSLKLKENTFNFRQNSLLSEWKFIYWTFMMCILPLLRRIFPRKKEHSEYLSRIKSPGNWATCLEILHPTRRSLSKTSKKPKSFRQWNFTTYLTEMEASLWVNFSSFALFWGKILRFLQKVSGNRAARCMRLFSSKEVTVYLFIFGSSRIRVP